MATGHHRCTAPLLMLFCVASSSLMYIASARADADQPCISEDARTWEGAGFFDEAEAAEFSKKLPLLCQAMRGQDSGGRAQVLLGIKAQFLRVGLCDGADVQLEHRVAANVDLSEAGSFKELLERLDAIKATFCRGDERDLRLAYTDYLASMETARKDFFCMVGQGIGQANAESFFGKYVVATLGITQAPSLVKLREKAKDLCISLRLGKIGLEEANIRMEAERNFSSLAVVKEASDIVKATIWDWVSTPFIILGSIATVIATVVGVLIKFRG